MAEKRIVIDIRPPKIPAPKKIFEAPAPEPESFPFFETPREAIATPFPAPVPRLTLPRSIRIASFAVAGIILTLILFSVIGFSYLKRTVAETGPALYEKFKTASQSLASLEAAKAETSFRGISNDIQSLHNDADRYGLLKLASILGSVVPKLKAVPATFTDLIDLSNSAVSLTGGIAEIETNGFSWLTSSKGGLFLTAIKNLEANTARIIELTTALKNRNAELGDNFNTDFVSLTTKLYQTDRFLEAALRWLSDTHERHLAIFFQNPSELRPAGGFLGSFADVALGADGIRAIEVRDIYDIDGQLDANIIPPKPLQGLTKSWGARDANWFFDFPTSARKVIEFLEKSKFYRERLISFDGAIGANVSVFQSILAAVGPIKLPDYHITITAENLLAEIQREVETGKDKISGEPKRILKVLAPILIEKLAGATDAQKKILFDALKTQLEHRDLMFYAKDAELQTYFEGTDIGGKVLTTGGNMPNDYLAIAAANIAAGKSDAYITQHIKLASRIEADGRVSNYLTIERAHGGDSQTESWYRAANRSYLQIFTQLGSDLTYLAGNNPHPPPPETPDYAALGFITDPDLQAIESTRERLPTFDAEQFEAFGKTVFAAWTTVTAGKTKKIELEYTNPTRLSLAEDTIPYQFVFERQSGAATALDFLIEAPPGYHFAESNSSQFNYVNEDPPGRVIISLTLEKDLPEGQRLP